MRKSPKKLQKKGMSKTMFDKQLPIENPSMKVNALTKLIEDAHN
jgi:hypothetical protein